MKTGKYKLRFNSFIHKLLGIIILLAASVILTIYLFSNIIFLDAEHHLIFFLMVVLVILFSLAAFFIHRVIAPIHEIDRGVKEISKGNLDVVLSVPREDELGKVATAFNNMTVELKKMIKSREQLLLDVSHELRTPITRAKIALEIMQDSSEKDSVIEDLREMEIMISELLETERLKSGKASLNLVKTNVKHLLQGIVSNFMNFNNRLKLHPVSPQLYISVDQAKIITVLKNIIENALKYSEESAKPVEINVIDKESSVIIQVEDYGHGIPQDKMDLLFEPFYRVDNSRSRKTGG
ncbi:MAG: ATP-binding protein, partial [Bacteroidales bacterium]|nr:ATP-binding protein [Bacteroidales bacterium]